jgi:hypothetical protein
LTMVDRYNAIVTAIEKIQENTWQPEQDTLQ